MHSPSQARQVSHDLDPVQKPHELTSGRHRPPHIVRDPTPSHDNEPVALNARLSKREISLQEQDPSGPSPTFFGLPPEVRLEIYHEVFRGGFVKFHNDSPANRSRRSPHHYSSLRSILLVNRQSAAEASVPFLRMVNFVFNSWREMEGLTAFHKSTIRHVTLASPILASNVPETFPDLQKLTVRGPLWRIDHEGPDWGNFVLTMADALMDIHTHFLQRPVEANQLPGCRLEAQVFRRSRVQAEFVWPIHHVPTGIFMHAVLRPRIAWELTVSANEAQIKISLPLKEPTGPEKLIIATYCQWTALARKSYVQGVLENVFASMMPRQPSRRRALRGRLQAPFASVARTTQTALARGLRAFMALSFVVGLPFTYFFWIIFKKAKFMKR